MTITGWTRDTLPPWDGHGMVTIETYTESTDAAGQSEQIHWSECMTGEMTEGARVETLTVLFADICGSTRLIERHGDLAARAIFQRCLARVEQAVIGRGGWVMARIGDELLCLIPEASQAIAAALDIQDRVEAGARAQEYPAEVRMHIGLHRGPVLVDREQCFGDTIHTAKRMVDLAKADQILTTQDTLRAANGLTGLQSRFVDRIRIKGHDVPVAIYEILPEDPSATLVSRRVGLPHTGEHYVRCWLRHGQRIHLLDQARPIFTIGRREESDLSIHQGCVSREHGRIEYQKGRIIFIDHSTNGTFVSEDDTPELVLVHREQRWLRNQGLLRFGSREDESGHLTLDYRCEPGESRPLEERSWDHQELG